MNILPENGVYYYNEIFTVGIQNSPSHCLLYKHECTNKAKETLEDVGGIQVHVLHREPRKSFEAESSNLGTW
jgi:hypothetical protein